MPSPGQAPRQLVELRARSHEVSGLAVPLSDHDRLARAATHASRARAHAAEAAKQAMAAYLRSAQVHERLADLYEELAAAGPGGSAHFHQRAERHRKLAVNDRLGSVRRAEAVNRRGRTVHLEIECCLLLDEDTEDEAKGAILVMNQVDGD